jgi:hypothetical protein
MRIVTNNGVEFQADWVLDTESRHGKSQLAIQLPGDTNPIDILEDLVGQVQIIGIKENGNRNTYEGYTLFRSLIATPDGKALRLTLERGEDV